MALFSIKSEISPLKPGTIQGQLITHISLLVSPYVSLLHVKFSAILMNMLIFLFLLMYNNLKNGKINKQTNQQNKKNKHHNIKINMIVFLNRNKRDGKF